MIFTKIYLRDKQCYTVKVLRLLILSFFLPFSLLGQSFKVYQVCDPQTFYLSSFTKLNVSGSSSTRKVIPVNLPYNTIKWFYSVSTFRQGEDIEYVQKRFNLFSEISKTIDRSGITSAILSRIGEPPGNNYVDVYLLASERDKDIFINKYSNLANSFSYMEHDSRTQIISGKVPVISSGYMTGLQYLGVRNTDPTHGIAVCIQVVAIIEEPEQHASFSSLSDDNENSAGQEYNHINNLGTLFENSENNSSNTNTSVYKERTDYTKIASPQNGWDSKAISELTSKYGDLFVQQLRENNRSVSQDYLHEFINCMSAFTVKEYRYNDYVPLSNADKKYVYDRSGRHCTSEMNQ